MQTEKPKSKLSGYIALMIVVAVITAWAYFATLNHIAALCEQQESLVINHQSYKCIPTGVWMP